MKRHEKDQQLLALIHPIKAEQPGWGYRMIWAYLVYREGHIVNMKQELVWINEFSSPIQFVDGFTRWCLRYNTDRPHSTLGYRTPCDFEKEQLVLTTKI